MSKSYHIRWKESDNQELKRVVRNFNSKIKRLEKNHPELKNVLPEKTSVAQMKELINTRQDLNRELNSLKRFSKRGSEQVVNVPGNDYNLQTTKWQKNEMSRMAGIINRKRKKRKEEVESTEVKSRGLPVGYTRGDIGMGKQQEKALEPTKPFTSSMGRSDLNKKFKMLKKESQSSYWTEKDLMLKQNYIEGLRRNYPEEDIKEIIEHIEKMDMAEFRKVFDAEDPDFEYSSAAGVNEENTKSFVTALKSIWLNKVNYKLKKENVSKNLKIK